MKHLIQKHNEHNEGAVVNAALLPDMNRRDLIKGALTDDQVLTRLRTAIPVKGT